MNDFDHQESERNKGPQGLRFFADFGKSLRGFFIHLKYLLETFLLYIISFSVSLFCILFLLSYMILPENFLYALYFP
jgi:hypothetical protein